MPMTNGDGAPSRLKVAVAAMGGDHGPPVVVGGRVAALRELRAPAAPTAPSTPPRGPQSPPFASTPPLRRAGAPSPLVLGMWSAA